ncbi:MAG: valine--tRNA ligase, partial [Acidaminococcaceae bacterium]|nr:valine--tRNA ligase [Acidaminococcaceae bacterium]
IMETIGAIRNMRAEVNAVPSKKVPAILLADAALMEGIKANAAYIHLLGGVDDLQLLPLTAEKPANAMTTVVTGIEVYLPLAGLIDVAKETARLTKEVADLDKELARVNGKLNNKGFLAKAPGDVVEKEKAKAAEFESKKKSSVERLEYLKGL